MRLYFTRSLNSPRNMKLNIKHLGNISCSAVILHLTYISQAKGNYI